MLPVFFLSMVFTNIFNGLISLLIINSNVPSLGASGAIMGLVATAILLDPFYLSYELIVPLPIMFVGWLTILADIEGIISPRADGIAHFAHLGGFLSVLLLFYLFSGNDKEKLRKGLIINIVSAILVLAAHFLLALL